MPRSQTCIHALPYIEEGICQIAYGKLFRVMDLRHGFHQMPVHHEDRPVTALEMAFGTIQWNVLPMGMKNAPQTFKRMTDDVLSNENAELRKVCSNYTDHIVIETPGGDFDECLEEHKRLVRVMLQVLRGN